MPTEVMPGFFVDNVSDIIGDGPAIVRAEPVMPARHDHQPEFPEPGIYFNTSDDWYHSINAASASCLKDLSVSPMLLWARSTLNPDREDDDTDAKAIGRAFHTRICEGKDAFAARYAIELDKKDYPFALVTIQQIRAAIAETGEKPKGTRKDDLSEQLMRISSDAQIWDDMVEDHLEANAGKVMISALAHRRIEIAARMIEADDDLKKAFSGGHSEVSFFWFDKKTGAPCKGRIDYLKKRAFADLKTFNLKGNRPVDRAIDFEIASHKHYMGVCQYEDAIEAAKEMIREHGEVVVHGLDDPTWALEWAQIKEPPVALYVFQASGIAPVTRGRIMSHGTVHTITQGALISLRRKYVQFTQIFSTDPWIDRAPISEVVDENIPLSGTDFGDQ